ncbi:MAG TPA: glycoside hydrolase family 15 protein [Candidatus Methylacidiphilales bacterium]|jgi:GH15 family glucan-1,4-alpha-glucosidase|nr:glycoside hydrolase family 15 protein [Candidatus Methylacidiphilales bacterium]
MRLEDYGFIGDNHTGALVGINGSIDWLCTPRFGSDACFAALLGDEKNGCWQISPKKPVQSAHHAYRQDTLILETTFETEDGAVRLIDYMPPRGKYRDVVRIVEGIRGRVEIESKLIIRFDYGLTIPWVKRSEEGLTAVAGFNALILRADVPTFGEDLSTMARFSVGEGERKSFILTWYPSHEPAPAPINSWYSLTETENYWRKWAARCTYQGEWRDAVVRSLLTLKGLTLGITGGIVAALTTSLPEKLGGVRNWDYRFCWLRDATFTLYSLMQAGYTQEAADWSHWLLRAVAGDPGQLQIMYGASGERRLTEVQLAHLAGYENSSPVRIGNAASEQFQLDVYGEVMGVMYLARKMKIDCDPAYWHLQRHLIDFVEANWMMPDEGIWEIRGPRRHFTHSKVMAWMAIDRAVRSVEEFGLDGEVDRWRKLRQDIHDEVCARGFHPERKAFTQFYGSEKLDASVLMMPLVGFLPATDDRMRSTIELIEKELLVDGYVLRYHPDGSAAVDGLPPGEGAFLPCTFWLADCLHLMGREEEARAIFQRLLDIRTSLGLMAEEYDPEQRRLVGNFPQAFTHVGLINTALHLSGKLGPAEHRGPIAPNP